MAEIENWQIEYDMQTSQRVVHLIEDLQCREGYHKKFVEFCEKKNITERKPIYKVRGNYVELLLEGGRVLPLEERAELANGELLASKNHPIVLVAPDGSNYVHTF